MSVQKINPDTYVGNTGKQLKDILTNADNISSNTTKLNDFGTKSLSSSGYQKITGGMLIQWGQSNITVNANVMEKTYTINYPKTFGNVYQVIPVLNDPGYGIQKLDGGLGIHSVSTSNFVVVYKSGGNYTNTKTITIRWIAIGSI